MKKPIEKQLSSETKKGKKSWKPAQRMKVTGKNPDYEYRWIDATDQDNLRRKQEDGWTPVSELHGHTAENGEKHITSVTETRGSVLHAIPKEDYQLHREYSQDLDVLARAAVRTVELAAQPADQGALQPQQSWMPKKANTPSSSATMKT